jgi:hypothetical protein
MARQEDTCWHCGVRWASEGGALRVIQGGSAASQAEVDATHDVVAALARWSALYDRRSPALAKAAT